MQGTRDLGNEGTRRRTEVELLSSLDSAELALDAGEGEEYAFETLSSLVQSVKERGIAHLSQR
jgi:hypothetical protein